MQVRHILNLGLSLFVLVWLASCGDIVAVQQSDITVSPSEITFSSARIGEIQSQVVEVRNIGDGVLIIADIRIEANSTDLSLRTPFTEQLNLETGDELLLYVDYEPSSTVQTTGTLMIECNDPDQQTVPIPITTPQPSASISVTPNPIDFGVVSEDSVNTVPVTVSNRGNAPLVIDGIELVGSFDFSSPYAESFADDIGSIVLDVLNPEDPSIQNSVTFDVVYEPPAPGVDEGSIVFSYNSTSQSDYVVDLVGEAGVPLLTVYPNPIDFGIRPIGLTSSQTVTVSNGGTRSINIHHIYLDETSSENFTLRNLPPSVSAEENTLELPGGTSDEQGGSLTVIVDYVPPDETSDAGVLVILYDEDGGPALTESVIITGVGLNNLCPVAVARGYIEGDPQQRRSNQIDWATPTDMLILDGGGTFDPDGEIVEYEWEITSVPAGVVSELRPMQGLEDNDAVRQYFIPLSGRYTFTLSVVDDIGFSDTDCGAEPATVEVFSQPDEAIHIELVWQNPQDPDELDDQGSDVDLHIVKVGFNWYSDYDCYYANDAPNWNPEHPSLDIDDTDGAGPENIQMNDPLDCQWYAIGAHYFEKQYGTAYATIRIFVDGLMIDELNNQRLNHTDDFWDVGRLHWPSGYWARVDTVYEYFDRTTATPPTLTPEMVDAISGGSCDTPVE